MFKSFINEAEVFAINENLTYEIVKVGALENKVVIVDNFYKNPELVRDLALSIPPTNNERILTNLPAGKTSGRINAFYTLDDLGKSYDTIIREVWPDICQQYQPDYFFESFKRSTFMVNVMTSENLPPRVPHTDFPDPRVFASAIYLNTPEECAGGTAFYSFGGSCIGRKCPSTIDIAETTKPDHFVVDDCGDWKLEYVAEQRWNRMIIYSQALYHTPYIKPGMFVGDTYRLNQQFFI